ncbi:MAG: hypothetical protein ACF8LL_02335, partial [Phycisphaerales bacterium]
QLMVDSSIGGLSALHGLLKEAAPEERAPPAPVRSAELSPLVLAAILLVTIVVLIGVAVLVM